MINANQELTADQAVELFKGGEKVIMCEYRFGKAERVNYRDKATGKPASFANIRHTVEVGDSSFLVSERVPDDYKVEEFKPRIPKGAKCLLNFDRFMVQSGVGQFSGVLVPIKEKAVR